MAGYHFVLWRADKQSKAEASGVSAVAHSSVTRRAVIIVGPAASEPMAAQLVARPELSVTWVASAGPALDDRAEVSVLARIEEYLDCESGPLLAIANDDGTVQFTDLA